MSQKTVEEIEDPLEYAVKNKDVDALCKSFFDVELYPTQVDIVRTIAFQESKNIVLNCYTRYGKTFAVGIGLALYLVLNSRNLTNFRIGIVGPADSDAAKVRKEMLKAGIKCPEFSSMIDTSKGNDPEDLVKSRSKSELTFLDGEIELHTVSASSGKSGDGSGAMGDGFDIVILEESNRIPYSFWKTAGDRLREHKDSVLVEMGNPFHKDNQFYQHWTRQDFTRFHVGEERGLSEGRHSKSWFDSRAKEVGGRQSLEYTVLYKSEFPDQVDDSLLLYSWVEKALKEKSFEFSNPEVKYVIDVADEGADFNVLTRKLKEGGRHKVTHQWVLENSSDTGKTAYWAADRAKELGEGPDSIDVFVVDYVGIGAGVWSKLNELGFNTVKFKAGSKPVAEGDRFQNKKARNYFKLRDVLQEGDLDISKSVVKGKSSLVRELTHIKTERRSRDKVRIVDPESGSPDFADSLMMGFFEGSQAFVL